MIIFESPLSLILSALVCVLHVSGAFVGKLAARIINVVNIIIHIALICVFLYDGVPLDEAVLVFMLSVFVYTLTRFIIYEVRRREDDV